MQSLSSKCTHIPEFHSFQKRIPILVTLAVAFCLHFSGIHVPDIARPHRPSPSQKAVIESQVTAPQQAVNKSVLFFAITAKPCELCSIIPFRTEYIIAFNSSEFPPLFPNFSRAPPFSPVLTIRTT